MLDDGDDRDNEQAGGEAQGGHADAERAGRDALCAHRHSAQGQAERAERHESIFNAAAGGITSDDATEPDAERQPDVHQAVISVAEIQDAPPEDHHVHHHQGRDEIEAGVTPARAPEIAVLLHNPELTPKVGDGIDADRAGRISRGNGRDLSAEQPTDKGNGHEDRASDPLEFHVSVNGDGGRGQRSDDSARWDVRACWDARARQDLADNEAGRFRRINSARDEGIGEDNNSWQDDE